MRLRDGLVGKQVEMLREPLGRSAVVHEHEGRPVLADELEDARLDLVPGAVFGRDGGEVRDRRVDAKVHCLRGPGVDDLDGRSGAEEARHPVERTDRGGKADALEVAAGEVAEPFEREREVRSTLRACDRVDLVDDDVLDRPEHVTSP